MAKRRRVKRSCLGTVLAALASASLGLYFTASPATPTAWFKEAPRPLILAHQGGEKEWPSNTMFAFGKAHRVGSDALDFDLHMTADKVLVILHDTTVDRTTNGQGVVAEMTWAQLKELDAAYRFTLDGKTFPLRGKGVRIPRLEEVLEAYPDWRMQIELKDAPSAIAQELAKVLEQFAAEDRVLLSSFDDVMMIELRNACPRVATSASPVEIRALVLASRLHLEALISPKYSSVQIPLQYSGIDLVTKRTVDAAHNRGVKVLPWTIDSDADAETCRTAGADGFNTNLPTKMERVRKNWTDLEAPLFWKGP